MKSSQKDGRTDGQTDRQTTDNMRSEKLTWTFGSGELKLVCLLLLYRYCVKMKLINNIWKTLLIDVKSRKDFDLFQCMNILRWLCYALKYCSIITAISKYLITLSISQTFFTSFLNPNILFKYISNWNVYHRHL